VIVPEHTDNLHRATGNIGSVKVLHAGYLNMADLLKYERLLFTVEALDHISRLWGDVEYAVEVKESKTAPTKGTPRKAVAAPTATAEVVVDGEKVEAPVAPTEATTESEPETETETKA
ncbi:MAG: 50S ribosomal protein L4, partial [Thermomicrobia bacterium]|nr:50S ribosomal protein L4 [Thermomicrobia bacterium]